MANKSDKVRKYRLNLDYQINHSFSIVVIILGKKERNIEHWSRKTNQYFCN